MAGVEFRRRHGRPAITHSGESGKANPLNVPFVLGVVRQWWKVVAPLGLLLATVGAIIVWWQFEPVYEAQAWLRIEDRRPLCRVSHSRRLERFVGTQIELIRSPLVIEPVLSKPEVRRIPELATSSDPVGWLARQDWRPRRR